MFYCAKLAVLVLVSTADAFLLSAMPVVSLSSRGIRLQAGNAAGKYFAKQSTDRRLTQKTRSFERIACSGAVQTEWQVSGLEKCSCV